MKFGIKSSYQEFYFFYTLLFVYEVTRPQYRPRPLPLSLSSKNIRELVWGPVRNFTSSVFYIYKGNQFPMVWFQTVESLTLLKRFTFINGLLTPLVTMVLENTRYTWEKRVKSVSV